MRYPMRSLRESPYITETETTTGEETSGDRTRKPKKFLKKKLTRRRGSRGGDSGRECCTPCCAILSVLLVIFALITLSLVIIYHLDKFGVFGNLCTVDVDPEAIYKCAATGICTETDAKTAVDCITGSAVDKKCCLDKEYLTKNPPKSSVPTATTTVSPATAAATTS